MTMSLYENFVPSARQIVAASAAVLAKAETHYVEHGVDPQAMIEARLAPDMAALPFQVFSVVHHSVGAIAGVHAGRFLPPQPLGDHDFASLKAALATAGAALAAVDGDDLEKYLNKPVIFAINGMEMPFTAQNFLLSFSQPNYYFHASILYAILRHKGVKLTKRDFMGMPRIGL